MPLRTDDALGLPIDGKMRNIVSFVRECLPTVIWSHRANDTHLMLTLTVDQQSTIHITSVEKMLGREALFGRQFCMNDSWRIKIGCGSRRGQHMGYQMRCILITTFGQMHLVSQP